MNKNVLAIMNLIGSEIKGIKPKTSIYDGYISEQFNKLFNLSKMHDMAHIVGESLISNNIVKDNKVIEKFRKEISLAVLRHENNELELTKIREIFNSENIDFIVLKGGVIRKYYKKPYQRTSCDIDVLIREKDKEKVEEMLVSKYNYQLLYETTHDYTFISKDGGTVEIHYILAEPFYVTSGEKELAKCWDYSEKVEKNEYKLSDEMFYYYFICHTAKHFQNGGCGIKPIIDLYVISNCFFKDEKYRELVKNSKLKDFEKYLIKLENAWLNDGEYDQTVVQMEKYILTAGTYGSSKNRAQINHARSGGGKRYFAKRLFLPYSVLSTYYPKLKKYKILLFYYEIKRIFEFIFGNKRAVLNEEIKQVKMQEKTKQKAVLQMLEKLGLDK